MRCRRFLFLNLFFVVLLLALFLSVGFLSADFDIGTPAYDIQENYETGDKIGGWINISFTEENYSSLFEDSFENEVSLEDLLTQNPEYVYNESLPNVTSEMQILYLDGFFDVPGVEGEFQYELNFTQVGLFKQNITIESAENTTLKIQAAKAINDKEQEIEEFKNISKSYTGFIKEKINTTLNILNFDKKLAELKDNYTNADSDSDYQYVINEVSYLKVPKMILETNSIDNLEFYPKKDNINLNVLAGITGEEYSEANRNNYLDGIFIWSQDSLEMRINFKEISASYGETQEVLFRYFEIIFMEKPQTESYLIIENMQNLEFGGSYNQRIQGNYYYINLADVYGSIVITTTENVNFVNLPLFVSPALADLPDVGIGGEIVPDDKMKISKWIFFVLIIAFLLVIAMIVYSIVSTWYDKKYEDYLFPNKNNLYNLIIYINNSKKKGVVDDEIEKSLKKSKWSNEQIKYVMRKYAGKRTGMVKLIPFKKIQKVPKQPQHPHRIYPGPIRGPSGQPPSSSSRLR